ncbi:MAG: GTP-binding protein [Methanomassiliicoccales archaeon]|nr:MAG: GTP-binding protein [Methanomassiliicoccales archaeon]
MRRIEIDYGVCNYTGRQESETIAMDPTIKLKITLIGEGGIGKTSLIKRYVFDQFSDGYITTIGTKVTKKELKLRHPVTEENYNVTMMIWDIMGQRGFREILKEAYFYGTQGAIAVCDVTKAQTLERLEEWIQSLFQITTDVPIVFMGNKCDLVDKAQLTYSDVKNFASNYEEPTVFLTSAKTGINVNLAFKTLAEKILKKSAEQEE